MTSSRRPLPSILLLACAALASAAPAAACDCARPEPSPEQAFEDAAFVAEGQVGEVRARAFELVVEGLKKGPKRARVEVRNEGGSCGVHVAKGARVLVYAGEAEGRYFVRQCASTRLVRGEAARVEAKRWATVR